MGLQREVGGDWDLLVRGAPLAEAERRLAERPGELSAGERAFIQASTAQREAAQRARDRLRRQITAGLAFATLVSLAFSVGSSSATTPSPSR